MSPKSSALAESESLHERVRAFAADVDRQGIAAARDAAQTQERFSELAFEIAQFQERQSQRYAALVASRCGALAALVGRDQADGRSPTDAIDRIPAVPVEAFRLARVALHDRALDSVAFETSGTTSGASDAPNPLTLGRGVHAMRTTQTYQELSLRFANRMLMCAWQGRKVVVALAPRPSSPPTSSLAFMMRTFMQHFDGRALAVDPSGVDFDPDSPGRWLIGPGGVDVAGLRRAVLVARERAEPLVVLATSFALVSLLDALHGETLPCPKRTVVMQTGGFKGRTREIAPNELRRHLARALGIAPECIVSEYGMTELTSQLYEGCLPGAAMSGPHDIYFEPPWLRVTPVDAATLEPVARGEVGLARFVDLGNVDSAVAVVTQDLIRRREGGIELLGRRRGAPPRGCSLAVESLVLGGGRARS